MEPLSLHLFMGAVYDMEQTQLHILTGLKKVQTNFHQNKIYPDLSMLIDLYETLHSVSQSASALEKLAPKRLKDIDMTTHSPVYEPHQLGTTDFEQVREIIFWALPQIQRTIEEGKTMFEFVDENLLMEIVGILPTYREEGYVFVPDNANNTVHHIRYEVSIFTQASERYRALKTKLIQSVRHTIIMPSAQSVKMELMQLYPDMPNPATYSFATDLDFPFRETIFPVAKRRLLRYLYS